MSDLAQQIEPSNPSSETSIPLDPVNEKEATEPANEASPSLPPYAQRLHGWRLITVEACLCFGLLLSSLDSSIVSTALVTIGSDFDDFVDTVWIVLSYLLAYMAFAIFWARLSDHLGRKLCIMGAWTVFVAFSIGCGLATSLHQLIAFRTLQGLGGCGLYSLGNVVMPEITPGKYFALMTGAQGAVFAVSAVLGPVLGGIISSKTTWRWIFYLNIPVGAVVVAILAISWRSPKEDDSSRRARASLFSQLGLFDYQSIVLLTAASTLLTVGLQISGSFRVAWSSALTIATLSTSGACWVLLVLWTAYRELSYAKTKIPAVFPWQLMRIRQVSISFVLTICAGYQLFVAIVMIPERYQIVNGNTALIAGVRMMPLLLASACGSTLNGVLSFHQGSSFYSLLICKCLILLGSGLLSSLTYRHGIGASVYVFEFILGLGIGASLSGTTIVASLNSNFEHYALNGGIVNQCRILGGIVGLAINTIIVNVRFGKDLPGILTPKQIHTLRLSLDVIGNLPPNEQDAVRHSFALAFRDQFRICMYVAAFSVMLSLATYSRHPINFKKRLQVGEKVSKGDISPQEGDRLVRSRTPT